MIADDPARELDEAFSANLQAARVARGISRRTLSRCSGIPSWAIERIEIGKTVRGRRIFRKVSIGEAVLLAEALSLKPGELLRVSVHRDSLASGNARGR